MQVTSHWTRVWKETLILPVLWMHLFHWHPHQLTQVKPHHFCYSCYHKCFSFFLTIQEEENGMFSKILDQAWGYELLVFKKMDSSFSLLKSLDLVSNLDSSPANSCVTSSSLLSHSVMSSWALALIFYNPVLFCLMQIFIFLKFRMASLYAVFNIMKVFFFSSFFPHKSLNLWVRVVCIF